MAAMVPTAIAHSVSGRTARNSGESGGGREGGRKACICTLQVWEGEMGGVTGAGRSSKVAVAAHHKTTEMGRGRVNNFTYKHNVIDISKHLLVLNWDIQGVL